MTARSFRTINRLLHIIGAAAIGTSVYSPWGGLESFQWAMAVVVIPLLSITGFALWKPAWAMRLLRSSQQQSPNPRGAS